MWEGGEREGKKEERHRKRNKEGVTPAFLGGMLASKKSAQRIMFLVHW